MESMRRGLLKPSTWIRMASIPDMLEERCGRPLLLRTDRHTKHVEPSIPCAKGKETISKATRLPAPHLIS